MWPPGPSDPLLNTVLADRFWIEARLGDGGMGVVYRARQLSIDRPVALKVLAPELAQDQLWVQRFINEGRAISRLVHPNTVHIVDFGQARDGRLFMAMELLEGESLRQALSRGPMRPNRTLRILQQICASLAEAHVAGIVHRDLKPDNVFLLQLPGAPDFVKVLDFSVAKLIQQSAANPNFQTQVGVIFGTPQYMSPEQGRGQTIDHRADLYAVGILGFEMLMAFPPFVAASPLEVLAMHTRTPPPKMVGVPPGVERVILRALEKDPNTRHQSAVELHADCTRALAELEQPYQLSLTGTAAGFTPAHRAPAGKQLPAPPLSVPVANAAPHAATIQPPSASPASDEATPSTVLLESSHGVVSFARQGGSPMPLAGRRLRPRSQSRKASAEPKSEWLYWTLWICAGVSVGLAGYWLLSRLQ